MDLSIIIVSWNVKNLLQECLESIYRQTRDIGFEIFVVDNNSRDGTVKMVQEKFPQVKLIANRENRGFATASNEALRKAKGDFLLLLNPDTVILDNALPKMVTFMRTHSDCGIAGCKLLNPDKSLQPSVRRFPFLISQVLILLKIHHLFPNLEPLKKYFAQDFDYFGPSRGDSSYPLGTPSRGNSGYPEGNSSCPLGRLGSPDPSLKVRSQKGSAVDQVMGAFFMIRREVLNEIGFLDENFFIWFEEVDFCRRAQEKGWKVFYSCEAEIIHHSAQSFKQVLSLKKQLIFNKSLLYYFKKHHPLWQWVMLLIICPISLLVAGLVDAYNIIKSKIKNRK